jgi:hypothetical protein
MLQNTGNQMKGARENIGGQTLRRHEPKQGDRQRVGFSVQWPAAILLRTFIQTSLEERFDEEV